MANYSFNLLHSRLPGKTCTTVNIALLMCLVLYCTKNKDISLIMSFGDLLIYTSQSNTCVANGKDHSKYLHSAL